MEQRKPTPIQPVVAIVGDELGVSPSSPLSRAMGRPRVPIRAQLLAERQATAMEFRAERAKFAITKTMDVHDHSSAETTASLLLSKHFERGFAEGELTEEERDFYAVGRQLIMNASGDITADAAHTLRVMARDRGMPSADVSDLAVVIRWLQTP